MHTVGELKQEISAASGMRAAQVRLVLKNEVLDDESVTLGERGVEAGSQVNAVARVLTSGNERTIACGTRWGREPAPGTDR